MKTYADFKKLDLDQFKKDEKLTIVKISDFGYPIVFTIKFDKIFLTNYAQYNNCIQIQGKLPRARKLKAWLVRPNQEFAIFRGSYTDEDFKSFKKVVTDNESVKVESWDLCFADGALDRFIDCDLEPVLTYKDGIVDYKALAEAQGE